MTWWVAVAPAVLTLAVVCAAAAALCARWLPALAEGGERPVTAVSAWTRWPALAVLGAVGGGAAGMVASTSAELAGYGVLGLGSALLVATDQARHRLPDRVTGPTGLVLVAALTVQAATGGDWPILGRAVVAGAAVGLAFLALALISPRALGLGDVKLGALLGIATGWLGWSTVLTSLVAAFVLGGAVALVLLVSRVASRTTAIPFGPWLILGAWIAMVLTRWPTTG